MPTVISGCIPPRGPRAHVSVTYFQFHGTTFHLVLVLFVSVHQNMDFPTLHYIRILSV